MWTFHRSRNMDEIARSSIEMQIQAKQEAIRLVKISRTGQGVLGEQPRGSEKISLLSGVASSVDRGGDRILAPDRTRLVGVYSVSDSCCTRQFWTCGSVSRWLIVGLIVGGRY